MRKLIWRIFLSALGYCCLSTPLQAQMGSHAYGARSKAMGNAGIMLVDGWALFNNPANMCQLDAPNINFMYDNRFGTTAFSTMAAAFTQPIGSGAMGLGIARFGDELFSQQSVSLGYSHQIAGVSIGIKANYMQYSISGLGSRGLLGIDFGVTTQLAENLFMGSYIFNLNQSKIADFEDERMPSVLVGGLRYTPVETLVLTGEVRKDLERPASFHFGLEYLLIEHFVARLGAANNPASMTFGLGVLLDKFQFNYAAYTHPQLGLSHTAGIMVFPNAFFKRKDPS